MSMERLKILVVDDESRMRKLVRDFLVKKDFEVLEAGDGAEAVDMVAGKYETESSGGITFDTLRDYAECGVDFISVGALTHSVKGLDMSFKAC